MARLPWPRFVPPVVALCLAATSVAPVALAQSPSPAPSAVPSPAASPDPGPAAIPWSYQVPLPAALDSDGPPDAVMAKHGVRLELWLSPGPIEPGTWVQAVVRARNVGEGPVWYWPGGCTAGTLVDIDLTPVSAPGIEQPGNLGLLKRYAIHTSNLRPLDVGFWTYEDALAEQGTGTTGRPMAECTTPGPVARLDPGETHEERFAWYAGQARGAETFAYPAGAVEVRMLWPFIARGHRPRVVDWSLGDGRQLELTAPLTLGGEGPTVPSVAQMIDTALADPRFAAWVAPDPAPAPDNEVDLSFRSEDHISVQPRWATLVDRVPDGFLEVDYFRDDALDGHHLGAAFLDARTGELLDVAFE